MNVKNILLLIIGLIMISVAVYVFLPAEETQIEQTETQLYTCGMHPDIISEEPGNCPICEMKLTPMRGQGEDSTSEGTVTIDPVVQQNMNVKTEPVMLRSLAESVATNGVLSADETSEYYVTTRVDGWVEKLYINYTGQNVSKGDKLMDIYSPELVAAQQEYLAAVSYQKSINNSSISGVSKSGDEMLMNAFRKLQLLEMSENDINNLRRSNELKTFITLYAQKSGTVLMKEVTEGEKIKAGSKLLHIADLSRLWLTADIYEYELSKIKVGADVEIRYNFLPGKTYRGKISFIYPTIDSKSRTAKIRIDVSNSSGGLKPEMFAGLEVKVKDSGEVLAVPESSVLRSGKMDAVILSLGDGKFKPQMIKLGDYSDGYYQVIKGVAEGDIVVTSAQFLIDSESNLKSAVSQFQSGGHNHSSMENIDDFENEDDLMRSAETAHTFHDGHTHSTAEHESIIHEGIIDVESIDKNGDGKVFECPMDWNIIDDKAGRCPTCEMRLKEYTLDETKENLEMYGYEYRK